MAGLYEMFVAGRQNGADRRAKRTIADYMLPATQGDQNALKQVYSADPNAGMQAQRMAQQTQEDDFADTMKAADYFLKTKDQNAYRYVRDRLASRGPQFASMPETLDNPIDLEGATGFMQSFLSAYGGGAQGESVQSTYVNQRGERVAIMRDGSQRVLGDAEQRLQLRDQPGIAPGAFDPRTGTIRPVTEATQPPLTEDGMPVNIDSSLPPEVQAEIRAQIQSKGSVPNSISPSGSGALATRPTVGPAEQQRLAMERERLDMQRQQFEAQQKAQAVTGKPPTEDERRSAGLAVRMEEGLRLMREIEARNPAANRPGYGLAVLDMLPDAISNDLKDTDRQVIESAQLDALDAALTLATGAAYTKEQLKGLSKSYFPQPNDKPETIKAKQNKLELIIKTARIRAGRASGDIDKAMGSASQRKAVRTGTLNGRKVVQYDDGTTEYAD